jgi:hypothetical protein
LQKQKYNAKRSITEPSPSNVQKMIFTLDPGVNGEGSDHLLAFFEPELEADSLLFDASVFADSACLALLDSAPLLSFDGYSLDDFLPHVFADFVSALDS